MTIPLFCPTKNRASQCRLLLESIDRNAKEIFRPTVVYKAEGKYLEAYQKLANEDFVKAMGATFVEETDFVKQLYDFLDSAGEYFSLFMDDCICYRKFDITKDNILASFDPETWCVSLRLGYNTIIHDYLKQEYQKELDPAHTNEKFCWWRFRDHPYDKNYGFHFSWDGVVYRTKDILDIFAGTDFTQTENKHAIIPQRIENYMMHSRDKIPYPYMCAPKHSCVVCMNWNSTHPYFIGGQKFGGGMEEMNALYLLDYVIDLDSINFSNIVSCHDELSFLYRKL